MKSIESKNIVIFILVLANLCLAAILLQRQYQQRIAQERATTELITLLESQGVAVSQDLIGWEDLLYQLELEQTTSLHQSVAKALLGDEAQLESEDGAYLYASQAGTISFAQDGTMTAYGMLGEGDALACIEEFCYTYGYENPNSIVEDDTGIVTATATYRGVTVQDTIITFYITQGVVTAVEGTLLPQTHKTTGAQAQVTAVTALTRFLADRRTTGAVVSTVLNVEACYGYTSSLANPMVLHPIWMIETDNGSYVVDGTTGAVSAE